MQVADRGVDIDIPKRVAGDPGGDYAKRCRLEEEVLLFLGQTREDLELEELVEAGIGTRQIGDSLFE